MSAYREPPSETLDDLKKELEKLRRDKARLADELKRKGILRNILSTIWENTLPIVGAIIMLACFSLGAVQCVREDNDLDSLLYQAAKHSIADKNLTIDALHCDTAGYDTDDSSAVLCSLITQDGSRYEFACEVDSPTDKTRRCFW